MTRINCVPVGELYGAHLVAEYRELPRVFGLVRRAQAKGLAPRDVDIPPHYRLGTGHVKFFYDKLGHLVYRQMALIQEMRSRGYSVLHDNPHLLYEGLEQHWLGYWEPTLEARELSRSRLNARLAAMGVKDWFIP